MLLADPSRLSDLGGELQRFVEEPLVVEDSPKKKKRKLSPEDEDCVFHVSVCVCVTSRV